jgi:hypothetical protein
MGEEKKEPVTDLLDMPTTNPQTTTNLLDDLPSGGPLSEVPFKEVWSKQYSSG